MRLTLRTMLAFIDDVLEGPDAQELGQKIDESKFASDLVHRIRSSVKRLRLGAPKVDGRGMGADANTVAEYLDNTMPPEHVPEFEKVCLESDVHLAEVAASHQVLTIVLRQPATVDPHVRDRMYQLGRPGADAAAASVAGIGTAGTGGNGSSGASAAVPRPAREIPPRPEMVPHAEVESERDQLASVVRTVNAPQDTGLPLKSLALTLALGFIVAAVALRAIAPFNAGHPMWRLIAGDPPAPAVSQGPIAAPVPVTPTPNESDPVNPVVPATPAPEVVVVPPTTVEVPDPAARPDAAATSTTTVTTVPGPTTVVQEKTTTVIAPAGEPGPATTVAGPSVSPKPELGTTIAPRPVETSTRVTVGSYISEEQMLARLDPEMKSWMVLAADTSLVAGVPLLSLPTYRPQVLVAPSIKLTVAGEAFLRLQVPDATNVPYVTIDFGRVLLVPVGEMGNAVQIDFAGRRGNLAFADGQSAVAVEVRPYLAPGADPLKDPASIVVQLWATSGGAEWRESDRDPVLLSPGQRGQFIDESPLEVVVDEVTPSWVEGKNLSDIDRRASQELKKFLATDRPLALSLLEQTNYRQVEVRALACRNLCYLDIFEPSIAALGDPQYKAYWRAQVAAIQSALPFGSATLEKLRKDLEKVYGDDAEQAYRLLLGYSPEQLAAEGAKELVDALEHEEMVIRVLAIHNLDTITGKTFLFRPEDRPEQEKSKILKWRKALEEGSIVYATPPTPLTPAELVTGKAKE